MKVFVHYEGEPDFTYRAKDLDASQSVFALVENFVQAYKQSRGIVLNTGELVLLDDKKLILDRSAIISKALKDGGDYYVVSKQAHSDPSNDDEKTCTRNGCGKKYRESENHDNACTFHHGAPVFHEGRKGWSCCSKRVDTFDEFMTIEGCTFGRHSNEKKVQAPKPVNTAAQSDSKMVSSTNGVETYSSSQPSIGQKIPKPAPKPPVVEEEVVEEDPVDANISAGTTCKHGGCNAIYKDATSRAEICTYHPGIPIFHEGSKKWSCCKPRAMEFDEFLKIEGCKEGKHRFLKTKKELEAEAQDAVQCRHDFYQNANNVILSVYAKNVLKDESKVEFESQKVRIFLKFKDGKKFEKNIQLVETIVPEHRKYEVLSTKIEITLRKATTGLHWPSLE
eukprot:TRINITY_DN9079_c0_g1_i2.p1 TRINITY_DN9079_c0_g1~~TRINITY_DN9079_c0_g1_i2.p1  ORF type:complete len:393 (+),score=65.22 TRINITY_DN9079_c0_g1_i2:3-1181(+)